MVTSALKCGTTPVVDAAKCGTSYTVDGAKCGYDYVTSGAQCGYTWVTNGAVCGYNWVSDIARCGWNFFRGTLSCSVANSCNMENSCNIPRGCQVPNGCNIDATCEVSSSVGECLSEISSAVTVGREYVDFIARTGCSSIDNCRARVLAGLDEGWNLLSGSLRGLVNGQVSALADKVGAGADKARTLVNVVKVEAPKVAAQLASKASALGAHLKTVFGNYKKFDLGSVCSKPGTGLWYMQPTDCGAFSAMGDIFTAAPWALKDRFNSAAEKFGVCASKLGLMKVPTPFMDLKVEQFCMPQEVVTPIEYFVGAIVYAADVGSALVQDVKKIVQMVTEFVGNRFSLAELGRTFHAVKDRQLAGGETAAAASSRSKTSSQGDDTVTCKFTVDNAVDSVFYNGKDITSTVTGELGNWLSAKTVSFKKVPGAYLVVSGLDAEDGGCWSSGFAITCSDGSGEIDLNGKWEALGSGAPMAASDERRAGVGAGWQAPCTATSGFYLPGANPSVRIWSGQKYSSFRWQPQAPDLVTCTFTMDNAADSVYYDGKDITATVKGDMWYWPAAKTVTFEKVHGAYLVFSGIDAEQGTCASAGFAVTCSDSKGVMDSRGKWSAVGSATPFAPNDIRRQGAGTGWSEPCNSGSGYYLPGAQPTVSIWGGQKYSAFRWQVVESEIVTCTFTVDNAVDTVYYNGRDITPTVQGALDSWLTAKTVSFAKVPGAYLTISGVDAEHGGCDSSGFAITCSDSKGVLDSKGKWSATGSASPLAPSDPRRAGEGEGWAAPCTSSSGYYLPGAQPTVSIWAGQKYSVFRWEVQTEEEEKKEEEGNTGSGNCGTLADWSVQIGVSVSVEVPSRSLGLSTGIVVGCKENTLLKPNWVLGVDFSASLLGLVKGPEPPKTSLEISLGFSTEYPEFENRKSFGAAISIIPGVAVEGIASANVPVSFDILPNPAVPKGFSIGVSPQIGGSLLEAGGEAVRAHTAEAVRAAEAAGEDSVGAAVAAAFSAMANSEHLSKALSANAFDHRVALEHAVATHQRGHTLAREGLRRVAAHGSTDSPAASLLELTQKEEGAIPVQVELDVQPSLGFQFCITPGSCFGQ